MAAAGTDPVTDHAAELVGASSGWVDNVVVSDERQGVALYGFGMDAVAEALRELDPRYVLVGRGAPASGQVPVLCCPECSGGRRRR